MYTRSSTLISHVLRLLFYGTTCMYYQKGNFDSSVNVSAKATFRLKSLGLLERSNCDKRRAKSECRRPDLWMPETRFSINGGSCDSRTVLADEVHCSFFLLLSFPREAYLCCDRLWLKTCSCLSRTSQNSDVVVFFSLHLNQDVFRPLSAPPCSL